MRGDRLDLESSLKELDLARNTDFFPRHRGKGKQVPTQENK